MEALDITLQMVAVVLAGIAAQVLAEFLRVPSIIFLLLFGIGLGPDGLNVIHPQVLGIGLEVMVSLSVALILFEGGLNLELKELGKVSGSLRNLVTFGIFITLIGGGMAAHWLGEFPWPLAFLYAALVVVTGPTVINPLLRQVKVDRPVATLLEGEGVLIDPVGAILAVAVLDVILNTDADFLAVVGGLGIRLGIGGLIGAVGGTLLGLFLKRASFLTEELRNLVVLAGLWGLYGLAQTIRGESGLMATVVAGIIVRLLSVPDERLLRRFKGQLTILAVSVLFVLLSADLSIASVFALGPGAVLTVLVLMFVVRPLNIFACTWNSDLNLRQKVFLSWIAPRGIVSASVASLFAILLTERGITGGDAIKALVFLTIILTVLLQGLSAKWVAKLLRITSSEATGAVIVGCSPITLLIARLFQERGESVVMIDTDAAACEAAEAENLRVFVSSALDTEVLEEAGLATAGTFLAMTNNGEVNAVVAQRAVEEFQPPRVYAVFPVEKSSANKSIPKGSAKPPPRSIPQATSGSRSAVAGGGGGNAPTSNASNSSTSNSSAATSNASKSNAVTNNAVNGNGQNNNPQNNSAVNNGRGATSSASGANGSGQGQASGASPTEAKTGSRDRNESANEPAPGNQKPRGIGKVNDKLKDSLKDKPKETQPEDEADKALSSLPAQSKVQQALVTKLPLKTWNTYLQDGSVKLGETELRQDDFELQQAHLKALIRAGELVPLLIERDERLQVVSANAPWKICDRIIYLLHDPKPKLLKRLAGGSQPPRLTIERLAAVEEVPIPAPAKSQTPENTPESKPDNKKPAAQGNPPSSPDHPDNQPDSRSPSPSPSQDPAGT
jgi:NhaP-type Na+/H+ or K+/H+ antiporter